VQEIKAIDDILDFAIVREVEANRVYLEFAKRTKNLVMKRIFESFAGEELEHKAQLELEVMKRGRVPKDFKITRYLVAGELNGDMRYRDVLIMAIKKESTSFRLDVDLAAAAEDEQVKETFTALAEQEARHKARFEIEYEKLTETAQDES
jgi:rubrerythrin